MSALTPSLAQRLEFAPPQASGFAPSAVLALLVHLMLVAALTWGVQWKHQIDTPAIEAELWSAVPELAAPQAVALPPTESQTASVTPTPPPAAATPAPEVSDAQIALEREKAKAIERERRALELAEQKRKESAQKLEQEKQAKHDKREADKKLAEKEKMKKREAEQQRLAAEREALAAKAEKMDKAKAAAAKAESDARYKKQMDRMMGLAGASGDANASGTALRSSGPSGTSTGYRDKITARIKPNIVFADDVPGNPEAEVEVRTAPDGSIVGTPRLVKSSGFKAWDDAVIKALLKTETLPRDIDGRIPPVILMRFHPKDLAK